MKQYGNHKKLTDLCAIQYGFAFDSSYFNDSGDGLPLIRIRDVVRGFSETYYSGVYPPEYIVKEGDYLIGMDGEFNIAQWKGDEALLNQRVCKISTKSDSYSERFAYYFLSRVLKEIEDETPFVTVKHLSAKRLNQILTPVPTIEEQEEICSLLDKLSLVIEKKKQQVKELDNLAQAIFYDMFGDPVENEKGWEVKGFNEQCNGIGDGLHGTPMYDPNGSVAFINGNNLVDGKIVITDRTLFVNNIEAEKIYIKLDENTVLLSINGTLGKTAIYNKEEVVLGKSACYCRLKDHLLTKFVLYLMNTQAFLHYLEEHSSKSTIKNVGLKAIRLYPMITPPLSLQQSFAQKIESIERQKELINQSIREAQTLFDSRMEYYFGE